MPCEFAADKYTPLTSGLAALWTAVEESAVEKT